MKDDKQPFLSHLEELRKRIIYSAIAIGIGFVLCYIFSEDLFKIFVDPLKENLPPEDKLIFTGLPEMFFIYLKTALIAGILLTSPYIFYQIWMFIAPGLYQNEKKFVIPFVFSSTVLFVAGALFGYFVVFPFGFKFFLGYANEYIQALPSVKEYFSFASRLLFVFGIVFELPVVIYFLSRMGLVTVPFLKKNRKYATLLAFILGAILTPQDVVTQCMMAGAIIFLYELGIFVAMIGAKRRKSEEEDD